MIVLRAAARKVMNNLAVRIFLLQRVQIVGLLFRKGGVVSSEVKKALFFQRGRISW